MTGMGAGWRGLVMALGLAAGLRAAEPADMLVGKVAGRLDGGRYSYVEVDTGTGRVWVACYAVAAQTGDTVRVYEGRVMENFHSPTLNRNFERIVFASRLRVGTNELPGAKALPAGHPPVGGASPHGSGTSPHGGGAAPHGAMAGGMLGHGKAGGGTPHGEMIRGPVLETMDGGGYTYVKVKAAQGEVWAAASKTKVAVGDRVTMAGGLVMKNFESSSLGRTFEAIHFVDQLQVEAAPAP